MGTRIGRAQAAGSAGRAFSRQWNRLAEAVGGFGRQMSVEPPLELAYGTSGLRMRLSKWTWIAPVEVTDVVGSNLHGGRSETCHALRWNPSGDAWVRAEPTNERLVYGDFATGCWLAGDRLMAWWSRPARRWFALGTGRTFIKGTLDAALSSGGVAVMSLKTASGTDTLIDVDVEEFLGLSEDLAAGSTIAASWDEVDHRWFAISAGCS